VVAWLRAGHRPDIVYAVGVNCIWGFAFVVPKYVAPDADPTIMALGRYVVYGLLSAAILLAARRAVGLTRIRWLRAFAYAFIGHVGYYVVLVWAISRGGVMVVAPIMATLPVSVAMVGNLLDKDLDFKRLISPLLVSGTGIAVLRMYQNRQTALDGGQVMSMMSGALLALGALSMWTAYAVLNARYLRRTQVSSVVWSQAMGLCCLLQAVVAILLGLSFPWQPAPLLPWAESQEAAARFGVGVLVLGVVVSWFSTQVWNKVSRNLPITVTGQLLVVQSLAAIAYASWFDRCLPKPIEMACVAVIILGVVWGVRVAYKVSGSSRP
jgi:drug/metabolite transporter (DMT)-like permease